MQLRFCLAFLIICYISTGSLAKTMQHENSKNTLKRNVARKPLVTAERLPVKQGIVRPKREIAPMNMDLQNMLLKAKTACAKELKMPLSAKPLLHEQHPTREQKCLMHCLLTRVGMLDTSNNRLSTKNIVDIASRVSDNNDLVVSVALALAENCNRSITATDACESAAQITKCFAKEIQGRKIQIVY